MLDVFVPVRLTQCAAVSTSVGLYSAPPQPIDSRTMNGNSPCVARVPPTTFCGPSGAAAAGDACITVPIAATGRAAAAPPRIVRHLAIQTSPAEGAPGKAHSFSMGESQTFIGMYVAIPKDSYCRQ